MRSALKLVHFLGLAVFLGSIAVYILLTSQGIPAGSAAFAQLRAQVLLGTEALTRPALLVTLASGAGLLLVQHGKLQGWQWLKAAIGAALLLNTQLFVLPAIRAAASLAAAMSGSGSLAAGLAAAVRTESIAGAINLLLALTAIVVAITRPALRRRAHKTAGSPGGEPARQSVR